MRLLICPVENPGDGKLNIVYADRGKPGKGVLMRLKIAPVLSRNLLRLARAYLAAVKQTNPTASLTSISRNFHGDPPFFENLAVGKTTCGLTKYDEIISRFDARWPAGKHHLFPPLEDPRHGPRRKPAKKRKPHGKKTDHHESAA